VSLMARACAAISRLIRSSTRRIYSARGMPSAHARRPLSFKEPLAVQRNCLHVEYSQNIYRKYLD
jgi:hypothetical protein